MNVLFLDIDGVLNSEEFALAREREHIKRHPDGPCTCADRGARFLIYEGNIDPACVARVNRILVSTGAKVVVSSTWRRLLDMDEIKRILILHGFEGEIIGHTPDPRRDQEWRDRLATERGGYVGDDGELVPTGDAMRGLRRGDEIAEWLRRHPAESFVILDDGNDMGSLTHRLVRTDPIVGLTDRDVAVAIAVMGMR